MVFSGFDLPEISNKPRFELDFTDGVLGVPVMASSSIKASIF
jgi:hypothetical protein